MKKTKLISAGLLCVTLFSLTACGSNKVVNSDTNIVTEAENKVADQQEVVQEEIEKEAVALRYNDIGSTDFVEISFDLISTGQEIKPQNPDSVYRYLSDQNGETYFFARGTIKNIGTTKFEFADNSFARLIVDDKYIYDALIKADEGGNLSYIYANLDPLKSETFYIVASVPDELIDQYEKVVFEYGFTENFDNGYLDREDCTYLFSVAAVK